MIESNHTFTVNFETPSGNTKVVRFISMVPGLIRHEIEHLKHNDLCNHFMTQAYTAYFGMAAATIALKKFWPYQNVAGIIAGIGALYASGAGLCWLAGHCYWKYAEYRADMNSSDDPRIVKGFATFFETQLPLTVDLDKASYDFNDPAVYFAFSNRLRQEWFHRLRSLGCPAFIRELIYFFKDTHPTDATRHEYLMKLADKLEAEQAAKDTETIAEPAVQA